MIMCAQACCNPHATRFRICLPFFQTKIVAALTDASTLATNARHTWAIVTATAIAALLNHYDWHVQPLIQIRGARVLVANMLTARILHACLYANMLCACLTSGCHAPLSNWPQSHSRWVNRPHTFDNSGLAKLELVNQIGRVHAPTRWARDSHGAHHLWAVFVDPPQPKQSRPLHWPRPARVDQTRACWGSLEIQEFQCE